MQSKGAAYEYIVYGVAGEGRGSSLNNLKKDAAAFFRDLNEFPYAADPYHTFLLGDHTGRTADMILSSPPK